MDVQKKHTKLDIKDLVTAGIFSAIYFVVNFLVMISGGIHPIIWIFMPAIIALLSGVIFMLMTAKLQKFGVVFIMGMITGLIYFLTGQFTVVMLISFALACGISEIIRKVSNYQSFKGNLLAYAFFSLGMTGSPLPLWLFGDSFLKAIKENGMPKEYVTSLEMIISSEILVAMFVSTFVLALIGGWIGKGMLHKHFIKAGVV